VGHCLACDGGGSDRDLSWREGGATRSVVLRLDSGTGVVLGHNYEALGDRTRAVRGERRGGGGL